jgi:hypothetical protein
VAYVVDFKLLAPHRCEFESRQGNLGSNPASLRNIGGSTHVSIRLLNNARKALVVSLNHIKSYDPYSVERYKNIFREYNELI